eukprot:maker-scaffold1914_size24979-snap-gene-0.5 protein:Tk10864 transcript:maker-scaffold1914_size24979-snap-gene-0.5-mRNA-1 annotation:"hypothetical protein LOTGIDRAFT_228140"
MKFVILLFTLAVAIGMPQPNVDEDFDLVDSFALNQRIPIPMNSHLSADRSEVLSHSSSTLLDVPSEGLSVDDEEDTDVILLISLAVAMGMPQPEFDDDYELVDSLALNQRIPNEH